MTEDADIAVRRAGCLCGQLRVEVRGAPLRVGLCHCLDCRKATGAAFGAFAIFPAARVAIEAAEGAVGVHESGSGYRRAFCAVCGGGVFGGGAGSDEIDVALGAFDEPGLWTPGYELWAARREPWLGPCPTVQRSHARDRPAGEPAADGPGPAG